MCKDFKLKLFRVNEENGKLWPRKITNINEIVKDFSLDETREKFMMNELSSTGRYWINDNEVIYVTRE